MQERTDHQRIKECLKFYSRGVFVRVLGSRSETELHLRGLQRHAELGGTVPRTPAGLKAPKQVSGSCYVLKETIPT